MDTMVEDADRTAACHGGRLHENSGSPKRKQRSAKRRCHMGWAGVNGYVQTKTADQSGKLQEGEFAGKV